MNISPKHPTGPLSTINLTLNSHLLFLKSLLLSFFYLSTTSSLLRTIFDPFPLPSSLDQFPIVSPLSNPLSIAIAINIVFQVFFFLGLVQRPSTVLPVQSTPSLPASALHISKHHFSTDLQWISTSYQIKSKLLGLAFKAPLRLPSACL